MRWDPGHESRDVVDRRGEGYSGGGGGGGLFALLFLIVRSRFGWAGVVVLVIGFAAFQLIGNGARSRVANDEQSSGETAAADPAARFVGFVLDDVQTAWARELSESSTPYHKARLVLFTDATRTACGVGQSATGPFYCPTDEQVYIDLGFFRALENRFRAAGDFARAYVIAHEIGHHVQHVLGLDEAARAANDESEGPTGSSVRIELQADCLAGVWAADAEARGLLELGDVDEALTAATAIGDDRLQRQTQGTVMPESFTHGTSAQRTRWFRRGMNGKSIAACDTTGAL